MVIDGHCFQTVSMILEAEVENNLGIGLVLKTDPSIEASNGRTISGTLSCV